MHKGLCHYIDTSDSYKNRRQEVVTFCVFTRVPTALPRMGESLDACQHF